MKYDGKANKYVEIAPSIFDSSPLELTYKDKSFTFEYALTDYYNPSENKYAYKLEGYDDGWFNTDERFARYTNIPAGDYIFRVRATGGNGKWSSKELKIPLHINQVYYKTWWFTLLIVGAISLLVYFGFRYQQSRRRQMEHLRTKIASDLHDEVGSMLTQISIRSELLKEGILDKNEEDQAFAAIAKTSREAVTTMSDVLWSIDARQDKMSDLIDRMHLHAEQLFASMGIDYEFEIDGLKLDHYIDIDIRQNILLIFKEAINNTVKHSDANKIKVQLHNQKGSFNMIIQDNGGGPKESELSNWQGISNMTMRALHINGTLKIDRKDGFRVHLMRRSFC